MLALHDYLIGKQLTVVADAKQHMGLLGTVGTKGVITNHGRIVFRQDYRIVQQVSILVYRIGKTGKFRLKPAIIHIPLYKKPKERLVKELLYKDVGVEITDFPTLDTLTNYEFVAWFIGHLNALQRMLRKAKSPKFKHTYIDDNGYWRKYYSRNGNIIELNEELSVIGSNTVDVSSFKQLSALYKKENRLNYVEHLHKLQSLCSTLLVCSKLRKTSALHDAILDINNKTMKELTSLGASIERLTKKQKIKEKKYEPFNTVFLQNNKLLLTLMHTLKEGSRIINSRHIDINAL